MAKKRANGEGSIRKRSDGRWEGRYTAGYHPETGKRIIKNVLGKTQAECKAKWRRCKNGVLDARPLRCRIHPANLHPRYKAEAGRGSTNNGQLHGAGHVSRNRT